MAITTVAAAVTHFTAQIKTINDKMVVLQKENADLKSKQLIMEATIVELQNCVNSSAITNIEHVEEIASLYTRIEKLEGRTDKLETEPRAERDSTTARHERNTEDALARATHEDLDDHPHFALHPGAAPEAKEKREKTIETLILKTQARFLKSDEAATKRFNQACSDYLEKAKRHDKIIGDYLANKAEDKPQAGRCFNEVLVEAVVVSVMAKVNIRADISAIKQKTKEALISNSKYAHTSYQAMNAIYKEVSGKFTPNRDNKSAPSTSSSFHSKAAASSSPGRASKNGKRARSQSDSD